jgi:dipeptidyl-peptidase 4
MSNKAELDRPWDDNATPTHRSRHPFHLLSAHNLAASYPRTMMLPALAALLAACSLNFAFTEPPAPTTAPPTAPPTLLTTAEATDFQATSLHAEVVSLLDRLAAAHPDRARRASMGRSFEDREIPLLILSDPPVSNAAQARELADSEGRAIVLLFGNIHAGEVDGKEALPILARELLQSNSPLLTKIVLVIAPIYNTDGNEKVGPIDVTRPGQLGPARGAGLRANAQNLDLNRDFIKLTAPETRAMVRFFNEWDPHLVADCHTTNGSRHRHIITYAGPKSPAGDAGVNAYSREVLLPWVERRYEELSNDDATWYGSFGGVFGGGSSDRSLEPNRWETFPPEARFGTTYIGLRGRQSVLVESYSYAPFKDRIFRTRDYCRALIEFAADRGPELRALALAADTRAANRDNSTIALRSTTEAQPYPITIKTFARAEGHGPETADDIRQDRVCLLMDRFAVTHQVEVPEAYAILATDAQVADALERLQLHGIRTETLTAPREVDAEIYTIDSASPASRAFQGHVLINIEATPTRKSITLPIGTRIIPTAQPLGRLAAYMLEPECEDGLTRWNFFDAFLKPGTEFPVIRILR